MSVGESVHPGSDITVTLTSMLPFAEYSVRKDDSLMCKL